MKFNILVLVMSLGLQFTAEARTQKGIASWYGKENSITCTGKKCIKHAPAVAHKYLPIGSWVKITSVKTKKTVFAVVEDRGPYKNNRIVDLNYIAAKQLGLIKLGITTVILEPIS